MLAHIARNSARVLMSFFFLASGYRHIAEWSKLIFRVSSKGIPMPAVFLALFIAAEIIGGLSLLLGYRTKVGAWILFICMIPMALIFHNFWAYMLDEKALVFNQFLRDLAIMGGLVLAATMPPVRS